MLWLYFLLGGLLVVLTVALIIVATKKSSVSGTLCFVPGRGEQEMGIYVKLDMEPKLYLKKKKVTFDVAIINVEDIPDTRNPHLT